MNLRCDLHTHTIASGHAYGTIKENMDAAYEKGLEAYGFSDHAPALDGGPVDLYFVNFRVIPREYKGMRIFAGVEANIMDYHGNLDIKGKVYERVDYVIASLHTLCIAPGSKEQNMAAYIGAMSNPYVKIIGHPDDSRYPVDYDELAKQAARHKVALELNNSSLHPESVRQGARENVLTMLQKCKQYGAYILCGTDAHIWTDIGEFAAAREVLKEANFPEELVLNTDVNKLKYVINDNKYVKW
ncbi:phosphatase [Clostridiales bacterium COT073_COT-073]|nr:phosphatase [Clostridiales bacterium COT073_COT-073]